MHRFQLGMSLIFEQVLDEQDEGVEMDDLLVRKGVSFVSCILSIWPLYYSLLLVCRSVKTL